MVIGALGIGIGFVSAPGSVAEAKEMSAVMQTITVDAHAENAGHEST